VSIKFGPCPPQNNRVKEGAHPPLISEHCQRESRPPGWGGGGGGGRSHRAKQPAPASPPTPRSCRLVPPWAARGQPLCPRSSSSSRRRRRRSAAAAEQIAHHSVQHSGLQPHVRTWYAAAPLHPGPPTHRQRQRESVVSWWRVATHQRESQAGWRWPGRTAHPCPAEKSACLHGGGAGRRQRWEPVVGPPTGRVACHTGGVAFLQCALATNVLPWQEYTRHMCRPRPECPHNKRTAYRVAERHQCRAPG
jgi:hypothetical protein